MTDHSVPGKPQLAKLRRVLIAAKYRPVHPTEPTDPTEIHALRLAWDDTPA